MLYCYLNPLEIYPPPTTKSVIFTTLYSLASLLKLYTVYCLPYSLNSLKSLELSTFKLINLGTRIILLEGSNARIGKYYYVVIKEGKIEL